MKLFYSWHSGTTQRLLWSMRQPTTQHDNDWIFGADLSTLLNDLTFLQRQIVQQTFINDWSLTIINGNEILFITILRIYMVLYGDLHGSLWRSTWFSMAIYMVLYGDLHDTIMANNMELFWQIYDFRSLCIGNYMTIRWSLVLTNN